MTEDEPKFANMYARHFTQLAQTKPLMRKPRVRVGTMFMTGGFLCWTGAILARHFREAPAPFFVVYNVLRSGAQSRPQYILDTVARDVLPFADQAANFYDLVVTQEVSTRRRDSGPSETFLSRCGTGQMPVETALQFAWEWAINGAGFGILQPETVVQYHEQMMVPVDPVP